MCTFVGHQLRTCESIDVASSCCTVGLGRHGTLHNRHIQSSFLEDVFILQYPGDATAASWASPGVFVEVGTSKLCKCIADFILSIAADLLRTGTDSVLVYPVGISQERFRCFVDVDFEY